MRAGRIPAGSADDEQTVIATAAQFWSIVHGFLMLELADYFGGDSYAIAPVLGALVGNCLSPWEIHPTSWWAHSARRDGCRYEKAPASPGLLQLKLLDGDRRACGLELGLDLLGSLRNGLSCLVQFEIARDGPRLPGPTLLVGTSSCVQGLMTQHPQRRRTYVPPIGSA